MGRLTTYHEFKKKVIEVKKTFRITIPIVVQELGWLMRTRTNNRLADSEKIKGVKGTPYRKPLFVEFL
jgi:hypothetical protein